METMTLRKANQERKLLDKKIESIPRELDNNPFMAFYPACSPFIGSLSPKEVEEEIKSNWQRLNDLIARREKLNRAVLNANASIFIKVPVFKDLEGYDPNVTEELSLAACINRKTYYQNVLQRICDNLKGLHDNKITAFNRLKTELDHRFENQVNAQFGPESNQSAKARVEYADSIKPQFETFLIDPLKLYNKVKKMKDMISNYVAEIDSLLSNATETNEVTID